MSDPLDIEAIKARNERRKDGFTCGCGRAHHETIRDGLEVADIDALIAEVERLRADLDEAEDRIQRMDNQL